MINIAFPFFHETVIKETFTMKLPGIFEVKAVFVYLVTHNYNRQRLECLPDK